MTYRGKVQGGVVVLQDSANLPEGTEVEIHAIEKTCSEQGESLSKSLLKLAGRAVGLPPDAARNHDHYLYGTPKR